MKCKKCKQKVYSIKFNKIPLVNSFGKNKKFYENGFSYCKECDIGFNIRFIDDRILYNKNYLYNGALNKDKINFFLDILKEKVAPKILEIGGGDGFLGQELSKFNKYIKYLNIDPSVKKGFNTKKTIFQKFYTKNKFDLIICMNVLAHTSETDSILKNIKKLMHEDTQVIFSVQNSLKEILKGFYDNVYHEHKIYYSPYSFKKMLEKYNFKTYFFYKSKLHGESIIFSNKKISKIKKFKKEIFKKTLNVKLFKKSIQKYNFKINLLEKKISKISKRKIIYALGCAPRSIKLLYDLNNKSLMNIKSILEPANSKKVGLVLPKINIKIQKEYKINSACSYLWMPYHIKIPNKISKHSFHF